MAKVIILGIILSFLFYEFTDITPGGIILPGLFALYITYPTKIIYTLVVSILTYFFMKLLSRFLLIFGKRRFAVTVLVSFLIHLLLSLILSSVFHSFSDTLFTLVSFTVSGILASNMQKQGPIRTVASLGIVTGVLEAIVLLFTHFFGAI